MSLSVYCVLEGSDFPEGAPLGIFADIKEAVKFINEVVESNYPSGWKGSTYIYWYYLGIEGLKGIFNHKGEQIK